MESRDYEIILNAMPETGVYVIRESDRSVLYFNHRVQAVCPDIRLGVPCRELWGSACRCCPLLTMGGEQESQSVSCAGSDGGTVDITAARVLWEGDTPAFAITVTPRTDGEGYTYRKLLRVDLQEDRCEVLKSDQDGWQLGEGPLSSQLAAFAEEGSVHSDDKDRFLAFTSLEALRAAARSGPGGQSLLYRRQTGETLRWNLMEVIPDAGSRGRCAILCVKDVHNVLREGQVREGPRAQELIHSLGERNFSIYLVDLNTGTAEIVRLDGQMKSPLAASVRPYDQLLEEHVKSRLHAAYQDAFRRCFSLESLRRLKEEGRQKTELLCQWRSGPDYRYISATAYSGRDLPGSSYAVLALQDVDERVRRELAHTKRDMQMAAILRSRFRVMNTVDLTTGQCERVDLSLSTDTENTLIGNYTAYLQNTAEHHVHGDDLDAFWAVLSLDHLREKAGSLKGDYEEEVLRYRLCGEPVRWIEVRVTYCRQQDQVMVNLLGQDITDQQQYETIQRQALEDRAYIISSLSSLFFCTYYIDLERDTYRTVTQLHRVGDVLGDEVSFTAGLQIYAHHFVHPDDREAYLSVMNTEHLKNTLRWWQPSVAVEYRRLPEGPRPGEYSWVRATAMLSHAGGDDVPQTAVYVAQDITEGRRPH